MLLCTLLGDSCQATPAETANANQLNGNVWQHLLQLVQ